MPASVTTNNIRMARKKSIIKSTGHEIAAKRYLARGGIRRARRLVDLVNQTVIELNFRFI